MLLTTLIKILLLPPATQILLLLISALTHRACRWCSRGCFWLGLLSLWCFSLPVVSALLHQGLEAPYHGISETSLSGVQTVVVLGAGRHYNAEEYGGDTVSHSALWRLRYGAYLAKTYQLPIIVSGGNVRPFDEISEAAMAAILLTSEMNVPVVWTEERSRNTWENAMLTKALLSEKGIERVALVTHAYHMRRSEYAFTQAGIDIVPMPTGRESNQSTAAWWGNWLPHAVALQRSKLALHEYLGLLFYRLK